LFFSQDSAATIAHIIPTMDRIDAVLHSTGATALTPSVKHALTFARKHLDKYYAKTDLSNVYRIAMGMWRFFLNSIVYSIDMPHTVLHPQLKLRYFSQHGWSKNWVDVAEEIVRDEFMKYDQLGEVLATVSTHFDMVY
jgi:hypothetical protein